MAWNEIKNISTSYDLLAKPINQVGEEGGVPPSSSTMRNPDTISIDCNGTRTYNHLVCKRTIEQGVPWHQANIECRFTLKCVCDKITTCSHRLQCYM